MVQKLVEVSKTTPVKVAAGVLLGMLVAVATGAWTVAGAIHQYNDKLELRFRFLEQQVSEFHSGIKHRWTWQMEADTWDEFERTGNMGKPDIERIRAKWQHLAE